MPFAIYFTTTFFFIVYRILNQKALEYVRRTRIILDANLSAWDLPYCESGIDNITQKENILLKQL